MASWLCGTTALGQDFQGVQQQQKPGFCAAAKPATTPCALYSVLRPQSLDQLGLEPLDSLVDRPSDAALISPIHAVSQDTESYSSQAQVRGSWPLLDWCRRVRRISVPGTKFTTTMSCLDTLSPACQLLVNTYCIWPLPSENSSRAEWVPAKLPGEKKMEV